MPWTPDNLLTLSRGERKSKSEFLLLKLKLQWVHVRIQEPTHGEDTNEDGDGGFASVACFQSVARSCSPFQDYQPYI